MGQIKLEEEGKKQLSSLGLQLPSIRQIRLRQSPDVLGDELFPRKDKLRQSRKQLPSEKPYRMKKEQIRPHPQEELLLSLCSVVGLC